jgi:integrase
LQNLIYRTKTWYFNRRVPVKYREYDSRKIIRTSLNTDSKTQAVKLASVENLKLEKYWESLLATGRKHSHDYYKQAIKRSEVLGFDYLAADILATGDLRQLIKRLLFVDAENLKQPIVEAVLGGVEMPVIKLDDALNKYLEISRDIILDKDPNQIRKWRNPRKLAIKNLINCIGNKPVNELTRSDMLKFRDWWIDRLEDENLMPNTANKNFIQINTIITTVSKNYRLKLDVDHIFADLLFDESYEPRPPFTTEFICDVLLNEEKLKGMNEVSQCLLKVFAETGVCFSEQSGILPEDIILNAEIPHIIITPRKKKRLKTKYRKRVIPLVGHALDVFMKHPLGFSHLVINPDSFSASVNKYLSENNMLPTNHHTVYSLRHSVQDRLLRLNAPDRVQAQIMGHKYNRPDYGVGATLEHKAEWLETIQLLNRRKPNE